jgi:hypothetical protein
MQNRQNQDLKLNQILRALCQILQKGQLKDRFKGLLIIVSFLSFFFAAEIANHYTSNIDYSWALLANIHRVVLLLFMVVLRKELRRFVGDILHRIMVYLLVNHFIDRYLGYNTWSWNDAITLIAIGVESSIFWIKRKKNENGIFGYFRASIGDIYKWCCRLVIWEKKGKS